MIRSRLNSIFLNPNTFWESDLRILMQLFYTPSKLKSTLIKNKKFYPSIRSLQNKQGKSISFRLRSLQRRLPQIWQWRRNRKAFRPWRQLRFTLPYSVNRLSKVHQRTDFRLNRLFSSYLKWRLNTSFKLSKILRVSRYQNKYQCITKTFNTPMQQNLGNTLMLHKYVRNQYSFNSFNFLKSFNVNGKQVSSSLNAYNSIVSSYISEPFNIKQRGLTQETSQLLNILLQHNLSTLFTFKYNPKLQRSLNSYYLLHSK